MQNRCYETSLFFFLSFFSFCDEQLIQLSVDEKSTMTYKPKIKIPKVPARTRYKSWDKPWKLRFDKHQYYIFKGNSMPSNTVLLSIQMHHNRHKRKCSSWYTLIPLFSRSNSPISPSQRHESNSKRRYQKTSKVQGLSNVEIRNKPAYCK